jgi:GTP cyclohydrolase I
LKHTLQHREAIKKLLSEIGEDPTREGLLKTPQRFIESFLELTSGYHEDIQKILNGALFDENYSDMVIVRDIEFHSLCEHHLLPFYGRCHVAYIPNKKIIGLSKIPRLVDVFAHRLQVQERLTDQIANVLEKALEPQGVGVIIEATHMCMTMRGVEKQNSFATTRCMKGRFLETPVRQDFLKHLQIHSA